MIICDETLKLGFEEIAKIYLKDKNFNILCEKISSGLTVTKNAKTVKIEYATKTDFFRAVFLLIKNKNEICFKKSELCAFKRFGIMEDNSRNAVSNIKTIKKLILNMALLGYNSLELYTEDTLEIENEPYFGYMRGRFTAKEIKEIENYCNLFGIELVPCVQTLAHLNQIVRYEEYDKITDCNDILFVGEERTYKLLDNIFNTISKNFSSKRINIGMDEAHMLGLGKYLDKHGFKKRYEIMMSHLNEIQKLLKKYGFQAEMWSDMFFRLIFKGDYYNVDVKNIPQDLLDNIPKDICLLYWDYYSVEENHFDSMLKNHKAISSNVGYAGGAWKWMGFVPDNRYSIETMRASFSACRKNNIDTCLITSWGDNGGECSMFSVLPSLVYASENAYGETDYKHSFEALTNVSFDEFMLLDLPNRIADNHVKDRCNNSKYYLYDDLFYGLFSSVIVDDASTKYASYAKQINEVALKAGDYAYLFKTSGSLCELLSVKTNVELVLKVAYDQKDIKELKNSIVNIEELIQKVVIFKDNFYSQWFKENKPFGLEVHQIRLGGLIERLSYIKNKISQYVNGEISAIEELNEDRLPFAFYTLENPKVASYNVWANIVSPSII